jgi:branched-chain amino acid transport system permease protein
VPRGHLFGLFDLNQIMPMYCFVAGIFLVGFLIIYRTIHSPFGQVLKSIRENEPRALSLGYNVSRFKLIAFIISAALSGLAGATKSVVFQFASLTDLHWQTSGEVILMTLLGGLGTIFGPVVGALTIVSLQHELSWLGSWVQVVIGAIFIVCVLLFRRGIIGELARLLKTSSM